MLQATASGTSSIRYKMVCCSYRGYWTSKGRPSERGIKLDTEAALNWVQNDFINERGQDRSWMASFVIWGQSIGAGFASQLALTASRSSWRLPISILILETPFLSIKSMLTALYPQKWLPYRYLSPFLRNHLDTSKALSELARTEQTLPKVLILEAGKDELVPASHADELETLCKRHMFDVTRYAVAGALHTEAIVRPEGRRQVVEAIRKS